jgi:DNA-binding transcriptional ArsR family regulator
VARPDLPRRDVESVAELKALAHPLRQRMLYHLAFTGGATATTLAEALGENTGATSYHLRQLERFGFIEEDEERSTGRVRWWRLVPLDLRSVTADAAERAEAGELSRIRRERDRNLVDRYLGNRHRFGDLDDAAMFSSSATRLTKAELARFTEEYVELLKRWWRPPEECPPDARPVAVLFYAFPWPGE